MGKPRKQFSRPPFHLLLFFLCTALLIWPFLSIADRNDLPWCMLAYLFSVWVLIIILLFVIGRSCKNNLEKNHNPRREAV
jgi:hypothetical protein